MVILGVVVVTAVGLGALSYILQTNTNVGQIPSLTMYLDGDLKPNATAIDWGQCEPGYTYTFENMTVLNTGDVAVNVSIVSDDLPVNWFIEWQANNTLVEPSAKIEGWLNLTIPLTAETWPIWSFSLIGETA
jgi:hypothetical protein